MIIYVKTVDELNNLINNSKSLVLDFYADWCGPCKRLGQYLESVKDREEYKDIVFVKLDVDIEEFAQTCQKYKVGGIPHVVFFKNSEVVKTIVGFSEANITEALKAIA